MSQSHHYSVRSLTRLAGVDERLVRVCVRALQLCEHDITVIEGLRTVERQREMVEQGVSWTMDSYHLTGDAVDLAPLMSDGTIPWDKNADPDYWGCWVSLSDAMHLAADELGVQIEWGGAWEAERDGPHFQLQE